MENLHIKGSKGVYYIPTIDFDYNTGICILSGESFLENTEKFYEPIYNWLHEYIRITNGPITFNFNLNYYNTSSSRAIRAILNILNEYKKKGGIVDVNWYLNEDKDLDEEIEDFEMESGITINRIPPPES
jgi:hypothetical protein